MKVKNKFIAKRAGKAACGEVVWYVAARQDNGDLDLYLYGAESAEDAKRVAKALNEAFRKSAAFTV